MHIYDQMYFIFYGKGTMGECGNALAQHQMLQNNRIISSQIRGNVCNKALQNLFETAILI